MMKFHYLTLLMVTATVAVSSCSAEDVIADTKSAETNTIYKRRIEWILARDYTTLFSYSNSNEAKSKMPDALNKVISNAQHRLQLEKGATQAVIRIVVEDGKGILWAKHFINVPGERMVRSINKKPDSHLMYSGMGDNYPALYKQVTETLNKRCSKLGDYSNTATIAAANDYLTNKLDNANSSAEFHIKVTADSAEIYSLK